jgi:nicotinamide riboside kinase
MIAVFYLCEMKNIVITGPECSGKSELSEHLSDYYYAPLVTEYARWYLTHLPRHYDALDLMAIAHGQEKSRFEKRSKQPTAAFLFIDTWDVVLKIWYRYRFGSTPSFLKALSDRHAVDHYLLCAPDLPWRRDPLRENPHDRDELFEKFKRELAESNASYSVISGKGEARRKAAIRALETLIGESP